MMPSRGAPPLPLLPPPPSHLPHDEWQCPDGRGPHHQGRPRVNDRLATASTKGQLTPNLHAAETGRGISIFITMVTETQNGFREPIP